MRNRGSFDDSSSAAESSCYLSTESFHPDPTTDGKPNAELLPPVEISWGGSAHATESTVSSLETLNDCDDLSERSSSREDDFQVGDHVYTWCSLLAVPRAYQHHGIVVRVSDTKVKIVDFYPLFYDDFHDKDGKSSSGGIGSSDRGRAFTMSEVILGKATARNEWKRVQYGANLSERLFRRSGTCSPVTPDSPGFVLSRIEFLKDNGDILPPYDEIQSNCECVAVWCMTGRFCSLQATAFLGGVAKGSVRTAALTGVGVNVATVTVPCSGVWGFFGFTTAVPLATAVPFLMPAIVAGGAASALAPLVLLQRYKKQWNEISQVLNACLVQGCLSGLYLPHAPRF